MTVENPQQSYGANQNFREWFNSTFIGKETGISLKDKIILAAKNQEKHPDYILSEEDQQLFEDIKQMISDQSSSEISDDKIQLLGALYKEIISIQQENFRRQESKKESEMQVKKAIEAWKKLNELREARIDPWEEDRESKEWQRDNEIKELQAIIDAVPIETVQQAASDAALAISTDNLVFKSSFNQQVKNREDAQSAFSRKRELEEIIEFAKDLQVSESQINQVSEDWSQQEKQRRKEKALQAAQEAAMKLERLKHDNPDVFGFILTMPDGSRQYASEAYPEETALKNQLEKIIYTAKREWDFSDLEISGKANEWRSVINEAEMTDALEEAKKLRLRYVELDYQSGGFHNIKNPPNVEAREITKRLSEIKKKWPLLNDAEINADADKWLSDKRMQDKTEALDSYRKLTKQIKELTDRNKGFPQSHRTEQQADFDERNRLQQQASDIRKKWIFSEEELATPA